MKSSRSCFGAVLDQSTSFGSAARPEPLRAGVFRRPGRWQPPGRRKQGGLAPTPAPHGPFHAACSPSKGAAALPSPDKGPALPEKSTEPQGAGKPVPAPWARTRPIAPLPKPCQPPTGSACQLRHWVLKMSLGNCTPGSCQTPNPRAPCPLHRFKNEPRKPHRASGPGSRLVLGLLAPKPEGTPGSRSLAGCTPLSAWLRHEGIIKLLG